MMRRQKMQLRNICWNNLSVRKRCFSFLDREYRESVGDRCEIEKNTVWYRCGSLMVSLLVTLRESRRIRHENDI